MIVQDWPSNVAVVPVIAVQVVPFVEYSKTGFALSAIFESWTVPTNVTALFTTESLTGEVIFTVGFALSTTNAEVASITSVLFPATSSACK